MAADNMDEERFDLRELDIALRSAFPSWPSLARVLLFRLNWRLEDIAGRGPMVEVVLSLLQHTRAHHLTAELVEAAHQENATNGRLLAFYETYFSLAGAQPAVLQKITRERADFLSFEESVRRQQEILRRVCRVEVDGEAAGTGFLVGPSAVLTNYHVVADLAPSAIKCRFDFTKPGSGTAYGLSGKGITATSRWSQSDEIEEPKDDPTEDELDFALLELEQPLGAQRGCIVVNGTEPALLPGAPLFIVQHPAGDTLQVALDTEAVLRLNGNRTRVRYRTNTLPGSSGSPCFDAKWRLVALHHAGDPRPHRKGKRFGRYNQGIPIDRIHRKLEQEGALHLLAT